MGKGRRRVQGSRSRDRAPERDIIRAEKKAEQKVRRGVRRLRHPLPSVAQPEPREAAVDEMLIQHLLTERLIRKIFDNPDFMQRNVIAAEVEKVIAG